MIYDHANPIQRETAENIWHAQQAGHPDVLTYNGGGAAKLANREAATGSVQDIPGTWKDEYPFATTREGGAGSWVGHVAPLSQRSQGGTIKAFIERYQLQVGDQFRVKVINYPGSF
jgi:hypothetical protein